MPLSPEKVAAYNLLEEAVTALSKAYQKDPNQEDGFITSYLLIAQQARIDNEPDDGDDELDLKTTIGVYSKRGQDPIVTVALAHEYIRHYNNANE